MKIKILSGVEKENDKYNWTSLMYPISRQWGNL